MRARAMRCFVAAGVQHAHRLAVVAQMEFQVRCAPVRATCTSSSMWPNSVRSARRNLRRAGTLKNRSRTSTLVPGGWAPGAARRIGRAIAFDAARPHARRRRLREVNAQARHRGDTEASASPRKPSVRDALQVLEAGDLAGGVAATASGSSSASMPPPSSRTRIRRAPPCSMSISMRVAPASRLFSTSSLTTDAGRSTTSPAAIWLTSSTESEWMRGISAHDTESGIDPDAAIRMPRATASRDRSNTAQPDR